MYFSKLSRFEVLIGVQKKKYVHCQDFYTLMLHSIKYLAGRRSQAFFFRLNPGGQ